MIFVQGKSLYLVHGMADANVHLQNSMVFANHLVAYNVPFQQQVSSIFQFCYVKVFFAIKDHCKHSI